MKVFQIQIQAYHGQYVDYFGMKTFTGPFHDRKAANRALADLQRITRGHHFNYRVDTRSPQSIDDRRLAA